MSVRSSRLAAGPHGAAPERGQVLVIAVLAMSALFAMLGLRSLYFLLAGLVDRFVYLNLLITGTVQGDGLEVFTPEEPELGVTEIAPPDGAFYLYADVGHVTDDGMFRVLENGVVVADIPSMPLTQGCPTYERPGVESPETAALRELLAVASKLRAAGVELVPLAAREFAAVVNADIPRYARLVAQSGARVD